jgi:tyrosine-protein kinase Etk/Wzc
MTTIPNTAPPVLARVPSGTGAGAVALNAQPAQPATAAGQLSTLDPVKLLNRHKWLFVAAAVTGLVLGFGANLVLKRVAPSWRPAALYTALPPIQRAGDTAELQMNEIEMNRFMQTQTRLMTSDTVITRVVEDPNLLRLAPDWCKPSLENGALNKVSAIERMKKTLSARVVPGTTLIELSASSKHKFDATAIVSLVRQKYEERLRETSRSLIDSQIRELTRQIERCDETIAALQRRRDELMRRENLDTIDDRAEATLQQLSQTNFELIGVSQQLQSLTTQREQLEADRNSPGQVPFSDGLIADVDRDPLVQQAKSQLSALESDLQSLRSQGISPEHRAFRRIEAAIEGQRDTIDQTRQRLLRQRADALFDQTVRTQAQLTAQRNQLAEQADTLQRRLTELTRLINQLKDINAQIDETVGSKGLFQRELLTLQGVAGLSQSTRVVLFQQETAPNSLSFPKLAFMLPAGLIVTVGLVGAFVLVREILDQRVKGPSDITIIPRTRLLGWLPLASEDPSGEGAVETAVRDRSYGIVAEAARQLRSAIERRTAGTDGRTLLVVAGMPASGATTVACNLALAAAAADKRVLLIDANLRRPALHRVFGLQEAPGVADALAGQRPLDECFQRTTSPNLAVLTVGTKDLRHVERFATNAMSDLLAAARERFDLVIVDTAPAIVGGDYIALAQRVDASMLVVRAMGESRGLVARVRNELGDTHSTFLGVVVNGVRHSAGGYMKGNIRVATEYQSAT